MTPAPATAARRRQERTGLRGALLAVFTLAALLGLAAMHVLPMTNPGPASTAGLASMTGPMSRTSPMVMAGTVSTADLESSVTDQARPVAARAGLAAAQRQLMPALSTGQRPAAGAAASGCGMDHAGCLATLTATVRAHLPAETTGTSTAPEPGAGRAPPGTTGRASCPPAPSLTEFCISRT